MNEAFIWTWSKIIKPCAKSIVTWSWTKHLLHWLIISAGTMAECVFLVASLWMTLNASVHKLILVAFDEQLTIHLSELATAAYVGLPELILGLAVVTTWNHVKTWWYTRKNVQWVWIVLFGLPTLVFLILSLYTVGYSVAYMSGDIAKVVDIKLPTFMVVSRALAGYVFAFSSLLYTQLGKPYVKEWLEEKDRMIASLTAQYNADVSVLFEKSAVMLQELAHEKDVMLDQLSQDKDKIIASLTAELNSHKSDLENHKLLLAESKNAQSELIKAANKSDEEALQAYSEECLNWLKSGVKTVSPDEITRYTGISKRKIDGAITRGSLQTSPRNKELILVSSLVNWLKLNAQSTVKNDDTPVLHLVNG